MRTSQSTQPPAPSTQPLDPRREGERRQLTVMFCDLVGSTPLSTRLDPEDLREVVQAYHALCATVIDRFGGYLAQYVGDGVVVYFGYPLAHEDDVQRAVRAGLEILAELQALNTRLQPSLRVLQEVPLQLRIGIHTGLVVVGEMGRGARRDLIALGETPNLAARVQGIAAPDTVLISSATYQISRGFFECLELGPQTLQGLPTPIPLYQVLRESGARSRFEAVLSKGLTPLVGREQEVGLLWERWEQAKEGLGQVVLLNGEPGIGKSRLVQELKERVMREGDTRIEFRCSPYHQNSALYPVIEHLQRLLRFTQDDSPEEKLGKLEVEVRRAMPLHADIIPLLAALLSVPLPDHRPPLPLTPQQQKQKTLEALVAWLVGEAERRAVLLVWEDLQWADPSSLELLSLFIDQVSTAPILTVLTFRLEFSPSWASRSHLGQLTLGRLPHKQVEELVATVAGGKTLPAPVRRQLVEKTDGVPLFVEELTKMVLESGLLREHEGSYELTSPLPLLAIPATLQDSLMARLDRLAAAKEVAQLGAALGRDFAYEVLRAVSPLDETRLQRELTRLVEAELLYQRGLPPQVRYRFKHALIQEAAYQSVLKSKRQQLHQQIAQVLAERFAETVAIQPELLAHHYTEAGLLVQAIPYWQRAGQRAAQRSAHQEAISHLTKGLELLKTLPETPEYIQHELTLQIALGVSLIAIKGYTAQEVEKTYTRALELCRQVGETPQLFPVLWGLRLFYVARAELQTAHALGEQLLTLAQRVQDATFLLEAHRALGDTLFYLGELASARTHLERGILLYDPQQHRPHAFLYGQDPGVVCLAYAALALWLLGYPDQACQRSHEALTLAHELSHPFSQALALNFAALLHQYRREGPAAQERAEAVIALSSEQGFRFRVAWGTLLRGWALAEQGQGEEGRVQLGQGMAVWQATGTKLAWPHCLALLAEVHGKGGQPEEGLAELAEALATVNRTRECVYAAELHRLRGQLLIQQSSAQGPASSVQTKQKANSKKGLGTSVWSLESEAEACFVTALEVARNQQAKSLELRAGVSLSRLWHQQGKTAEARQLLAEIYNWFTEGFDTADLREAKALLEELSQGSVANRAAVRA